MQIVAHAGCMGTPRDSLESVRAAVRERADAVEIDVRFAGDGTAVIGHDARSQGEHLESAFDLLADHPGVRVNLDIKEPSGSPALTALLARSGMGSRCYLTGLHAGDIPVVQRRWTGIPYALNLDGKATAPRTLAAARDLIVEARRLGAFALNVDYRHLGRELASACAEAEMPLHVWTVDDERDMRRMIEWGVQSITTNRVDVLARLLGR